MVMKVAFGYRCFPIRFGSEQEPLFQTRRMTVFSDGTNRSQTRTIRWGELFQMMRAALSIFQASRREGEESASKPAQEAAGLRIELGGTENHTPQTIQQQKMGLKAVLIASLKEGLSVFWGKIKWLSAQPPKSKIENIKNIIESLFYAGKHKSRAGYY